MKVVQELVQYFDRRGQLTRKQIHALLEQGFLAGEAPNTMLELGDQIGASYYFRVKGNPEGQVWGTGTYTGDSNVATAAIHAGLVKAGEVVVVKATVVQPLPKYQGSNMHGITSHDFGRYGTAYKLSAI
ncbi:MAG: hypothetical protein KF794_12110 [Xanthobacteraceae bacterium]|nr:hypothetical protein [Xanthobacteraceae bacterium]QYK44508.1 MAG: hypothetical protein KF794_12110 [Xanthobacteraceae bacterium]